MNYARRINTNSTVKNEFFWSCLNAKETSLKMIITPALQLMIVSSDQCIEELLGKSTQVDQRSVHSLSLSLVDIWLMFNCTYIHVHCQSLLFVYKWPPASSTTNLTRSFRIRFSNEKDLQQCLKILADYFPIQTYSSENVNTRLDSSQPTMFQSLFFNETKDALASEFSTTMNIRTDFLRQYLSTCLMDPTFFLFVNHYEQMLKKILMDK